MLRALKDLFNPKRREARRRIKNLFGSSLPRDLVDKMVEEASGSAATSMARERVRVIAFHSVDWGFSDASLPKLHSLLERIEAPADLLHSGLSIILRGENAEAQFTRIRMLLEAAAQEAEFAGFRVGVAEGYAESFADVGKITAQAFRNERA